MYRYNIDPMVQDCLTLLGFHPLSTGGGVDHMISSCSSGDISIMDSSDAGAPEDMSAPVSMVYLTPRNKWDNMTISASFENVIEFARELRRANYMDHCLGSLHFADHMRFLLSRSDMPFIPSKDCAVMDARELRCNMIDMVADYQVIRRLKRIKTVLTFPFYSGRFWQFEINELYLLRVFRHTGQYYVMFESEDRSHGVHSDFKPFEGYFHRTRS